MKALLYKDFLVLKKNLRMVLLLDLLFVLVGFFGNVNSFFLIFPMVMLAALVPSLIAYDERTHFDRFCDMMPVSRRLQVSEKYLLGLVYMAVIFCLCLPGVLRHYPSGSTERSLMMISMLAAGVVPTALMLPLIFKFGMEKGRIFYFLFYFSGILLANIAADAAGGAALAVGAKEILLALLAMLALYALSWLLSIRLYEKREL